MINKKVELKRIIFKKLLGRFDYNIELKDKLTILTGPNGFGKSTILKTIEAISRGVEGISYFNSLNFEEIIFDFKNYENIQIRKENETMYINNTNSLNKNLELMKSIINNGEIKIEKKDYYAYYKLLENLIERKINVEYKNMLKKSRIHNQKNMNRLNDLSNEDKINNIMKRLKENLQHVYFIKDQRMMKEKQNFESYEFKHDNGMNSINIIEELPQKIKKHINVILENYSEKSNELDSTYPTRLFKFKYNKKITEYEFKENLHNMYIKTEKLKEYGLFLKPNTEYDEIMFNPEDSKALKIYFEDFDTKYRIYDKFIKKLDLYKSILNSRLSFKKIVISKEKGIEILAEDTDREIKLNSLSSGERQEILIFYYLIFEAESNILLLIDEPEISLHVTWQRKFIDDLLKVIEDKKINVIISTHSPQIIGNHQEKQIDLGGLYHVQNFR
ncbi:AAA ATPase domain protein [Leptotrichia wadei]|uniref:AAA ATPase domain protein n=1 Tax=Leptotrichia wadei TaxID=157687 RepID=A0A510K957_9FUSO|nr:AAA family ATPase [Leptotrichia wadei]BBM48149.1 AAA ATPase domain protein [Leptotrichia wadei]